jgi:hypothetical protein
MEQQLFKISGARASGVVNFDRYTLEDALAKASEMLQDGMDHLKITTPGGQIIDETEILELIDE